MGSAVCFSGCQRDVTKHASAHEYEPAAFTAITVSVALIQTAVHHEETPTPEEASRLTAGLIMSHTHGRIHGFTGAHQQKISVNEGRIDC